jgi:hypothetical protein
MKKLIKRFLRFISEVIYLLTPLKFKKKTIYDLYEEEEKIKCYNHFKKYFKNSIFLYSKEIRKYAINTALDLDKKKDGSYIEFGVGQGISINYFSKFVGEIYGFDSFDGLREDWVGFSKSKGSFTQFNKVPSLNNNVKIIKGWVQDTLKNFLEKNQPKITFVHMDMDTYETSKFILENIKPYMQNEAIILFDQLYNFPAWDGGEYKALKEVFNEEDYDFKAFSIDNRRVVIKIRK